MFFQFASVEDLASEVNYLRLSSREASTTLDGLESQLDGLDMLEMSDMFAERSLPDGEDISLTDLLEGRQSEDALEKAKKLLTIEFSPCIQCPFLHRAWKVLVHASKHYADNLCVLLQERFLLAVRLHLPARVPVSPVPMSSVSESPGTVARVPGSLGPVARVPLGRNDFGIPPTSLATLSREQLVEEARTCRTLLDTKCTQMPFDLCRFLQRYGTVMCMLCERAEAVLALTEAIRVAIECKLHARGVLFAACLLVLHLLGNDCFEFFLLLARSAQKVGDSEVFDVCTRRAVEFASTDEQKAVLQHFLDAA